MRGDVSHIFSCSAFKYIVHTLACLSVSLSFIFAIFPHPFSLNSLNRRHLSSHSFIHSISFNRSGNVSLSLTYKMLSECT